MRTVLDREFYGRFAFAQENLCREDVFDEILIGSARRAGRGRYVWA